MLTSSSHVKLFGKEVLSLGQLVPGSVGTNFCHPGGEGCSCVFFVPSVESPESYGEIRLPTHLTGSQLLEGSKPICPEGDQQVERDLSSVPGSGGVPVPGSEMRWLCSRRWQHGEAVL